MALVRLVRSLTPIYKIMEDNRPVPYIPIHISTSSLPTSIVSSHIDIFYDLLKIPDEAKLAEEIKKLHGDEKKMGIGKRKKSFDVLAHQADVFLKKESPEDAIKAIAAQKKESDDIIQAKIPEGTVINNSDHIFEVNFNFWLDCNLILLNEILTHRRISELEAKLQQQDQERSEATQLKEKFQALTQKGQSLEQQNDERNKQLSAQGLEMAAMSADIARMKLQISEDSHLPKLLEDEKKSANLLRIDLKKTQDQLQAKEQSNKALVAVTATNEAQRAVLLRTQSTNAAALAQKEAALKDQQARCLDAQKTAERERKAANDWKRSSEEKLAQIATLQEQLRLSQHTHQALIAQQTASVSRLQKLHQTAADLEAKLSQMKAIERERDQKALEAKTLKASLEQTTQQLQVVRARYTSLEKQCADLEKQLILANEEENSDSDSDLASDHSPSRNAGARVSAVGRFGQARRPDDSISGSGPSPRHRPLVRKAGAL